MINSGHIRSASVIRLVGDNHEPQRFSVWAPVIFASIRDLPNDALMDRTIAIRLERRKRGEGVSKLPITHKADCAELRSRLLRWSNDHMALAVEHPTLPPEIANDRAMDNWLPLFTIAEMAEGEWPERIDSSYRLLNQLDEEEVNHTLLLKDIKAVFQSAAEVDRTDKLASTSLVKRLLKFEDRPWGELFGGRALTAYTLATMLKDFGIKPKVLRIAEKSARGYSLDMFSDVFDRYLA